MAVAERELVREGRRVLSGLAQGWLEQRRSGFALCLRPQGRALAWVDERLVDAFLSRGWIVREGAGLYRRTPQGEAWLSDEAANSAFRAQHGECMAEEGGVLRDQAPTPLDVLKRLSDARGRPFLDDAAREAAERLQHDFELAQLRPRLTLDPSAVGGGRGSPFAAGNVSLTAIEARRRCLDAFEAAGPVLADILFETVCMARGLNEAERGFGLPQRSAKMFLRLALQRLAGHYGLVSGQRRSGLIEAWRAEVAS